MTLGNDMRSRDPDRLTVVLRSLLRPIPWARRTAVPAALGGLIGLELAAILLLRFT